MQIELCKDSNGPAVQVEGRSIHPYTIHHYEAVVRISTIINIMQKFKDSHNSEP